jgi:DNA-directed RNA polymerase-3 subunit RPC5
MFAKSADGSKTSGDKNELPSFTSGRMDKSSFTSSKPIEGKRFAVAVMQDKQLHLVPVKSFFQMRQAFSHFDKGDKRTKADKGEPEVEEEEEDLKQVTVKFARPAGDTERIKKARERSYQFISSIGKDEPWCETLIYPKNAPESLVERQKIPYSSTIPHQLTSIPIGEYFGSLVGLEASALYSPTGEIIKTEETPEERINALKGAISKRLVKKLPLLEQLKTILKDAKVLSFNNLMDMVGNAQVTPDKVLRSLTLCGIMIRGNWTLQSEFLYPLTFISTTNGITTELMCRGRDYILFKLIKNELMSLTRQRISAITQLPPEEAREVLESVASLKSNKTWDLLKPPDYDFEKRHPEVIQRQEAFWKTQEEKFTEMEAEKTEKRKRTRSIREAK